MAKHKISKVDGHYLEGAEVTVDSEINFLDANPIVDSSNGDFKHTIKTNTAAAYKIQGMFMDDAVKTSHVTKVALVPVGENKFFIDGHRNGGMQDLIITITESDLTLIDGSEKIKGNIVAFNKATAN